ncbi:hypothetical protein [Brucella rhizosphaerae]|uniref:hypothetical protein n=1 Tax=Brucella rhizosphaerae TaxID=571254 RepID=UPI0036245B6D
MLQRRAHQIFHAALHLVELLAGIAHFLPLHVENRQAPAPVLHDRFISPRIAVNSRLKRRLPPRPLGQPVGRRRLPQAPFPFRSLCALLRGRRTRIELEAGKHTAPLLLGLLRPFLVDLRAILAGAVWLAALGRRAAPEFQALKRIATLLSIAGEILARICTTILPEIRADFLRGSPIKGMIPVRRLSLRT